MAFSLFQDYPSTRLIAELAAVPHVATYVFKDKPSGCPEAVALNFFTRGSLKERRWLGTIDYATSPATVRRPAP